MKDIIFQELTEAQQLLTRFLESPESLAQIERAARVMSDAILKGNKIISCGNGGSFCDAMHFAEELSGLYRGNRKALPAISISDASHITCAGNDFGFNAIYSRFVEGRGCAGDVLLGITTSGNSGNIIEAAKAAREKGMTVVVLSGKDGGKIAPLADIEIRVPHFGFSDRIQEIHIKVIHILILLIEKSVIAN